MKGLSPIGRWHSLPVRLVRRGLFARSIPFRGIAVLDRRVSRHAYYRRITLRRFAYHPCNSRVYRIRRYRES